ncbi:MAG: efflux RND transporter periplasmic adaptor subunit [Chloroflexi bacterium]|nr:efflux RND transporter periplasmic adaptor subunit [Chloroflexota bacterium]
MWNKKYLWILIPIILVLAGVGYFYTNATTASNDETETPSVQTAVARQGDLTIFASGAGQVVPSTEIDLGFNESGSLSEIFVTVGSEVQTGQVLASLQTNHTAASIASSITSAELSVITAEQNLEQLYQAWELTAALALQDVAAAENAIDEAQVAYNRTNLTASQATIDTEYADMILARNALEKAEAQFEQYANRPEDNLNRAQAQSALSIAQYNYDNAVANYNAAIGTSNEIDQLIAEADLAVAQALFVAAQQSLEQVKDAPSAEEVALAQAQLANAEAQLALALEEQVYINLVAPMNGTILSINANVGENINSEAFITLADLEQPLLEIYLDETDLDKIAVGFGVEVVFDAMRDEIFTGQVIEVDPSLDTISGVQVIRALVSLDSESFAKPQILPIGLNASVDVIGGHTEDAILIPVEALRELGPDEYAVFVMEDGEAKLRMVTVGLMDFTSVEILSGLDAGEIVTTGIVETK